MYFVHDVQVVRGEPPEGNPYRAVGSGQALMFSARVYALWLFCKGRDASAYTLWYAPSCGGAKRIEAKDVHWESSGINTMKGDWKPDPSDRDFVVCASCGAKAFLKGGMYTDDGLVALCRCK
jgi:hypothetical protein